MSSFDVFSLEWCEEFFSTYLLSVRSFVSDFKKLATGSSDSIVGYNNGQYYIYAQPLKSLSSYASNGKNYDITFNSLLPAGFIAVFAGLCCTASNTGDHGGRFRNYCGTGDHEKFRLCKKNELWNYQLGVVDAWKQGGKRYEEINQITFSQDSLDEDVHWETVYDHDGIIRNSARSIANGVTLSASIFPMGDVMGWSNAYDNLEALLANRGMTHDPYVGKSFSGNLFTVNTFNGGFAVKRQSPLITVLRCAMDNMAWMEPGVMAVQNVPPLDKDMAVDLLISYGDTIFNTVFNPLSVIGGNNVTYSAEQLVTNADWALFFNDFVGAKNNKPALRILALPDQVVLEDRDDEAFSLPIIIYSQAFYKNDYPASMSLDSTTMICPDFMILRDVDSSLAYLTIDDLAALCFELGTKSSISLCCGITGASAQYTITRADVVMTDAGRKVLIAINKVINEKIAKFCFPEYIQKVKSVYACFFMQVLMVRQCGGSWYCFSSNEIILSKKYILGKLNEEQTKQLTVLTGRSSKFSAEKVLDRVTNENEFDFRRFE